MVEFTVPALESWEAPTGGSSSGSGSKGRIRSKRAICGVVIID